MNHFNTNTANNQQYNLFLQLQGKYNIEVKQKKSSPTQSEEHPGHSFKKLFNIQARA